MPHAWMRWLVAALIAGNVGCASIPVPAHVWMPIRHVEAVDLFWWDAEQICQIRVIYWKLPGTPVGITVDVDTSLCLERMKAEGYAVPSHKGEQ